LDFKLIVVTNQPDIARGKATRASIDELNEHLRRELPVDDLLMCPHDNGDGCDCRKPKPGLLFRAAEKHGLDLRSSFMVGDRWSDVDAGAAAGCFTVFIDYRYNERGPTSPPDARVSSLQEAVDAIVQHSLVGEIG
jgi:D-glycero-D-manno-heptose 1,7-bisphosphate phosphatase